MAEDETTFLCGYKGLRRYGTTTSASSSTGAKRCNYSTIIKHRVLPSDTLQGIALKYGASTTEIKRLNKLWSNDSIHLREILRVPILSSDVSPSSTSFGVLSSFPRQTASSGTVVLNGRDSCYDSMSENEDQQYLNQQQQRTERKQSVSEDDDGNVSSHSAAAAAGTSGAPAAKRHAAAASIDGQKKMSSNNYDKSDCSIKDLLNRIDSSIKMTASNVKRLEKQSTIDQILQDADCAPSSSSMSASQSTHSPWGETSSAGAPSPPPEVIRTEVRRPHDRYSMRKLQEVHDQLYQL